MRFSTCMMSSSDSNWASRNSIRPIMPKVSKICWRCSSFNCKCAAIVSTKRLLSSIPLMVLMISAGIFLFNLAYWSNWVSSVRRMASISGLSASAYSSTASTWDRNNPPLSSIVNTLPRRIPSTNTFTVPSGSFNTCKTCATVPVRCKSDAVGSSVFGSICASKNTGSSFAIAASNAAMDFGRPTNSGNTICG